jgi:competence ComEA-like helix-hairpin-helix protein
VLGLAFAADSAPEDLTMSKVRVNLANPSELCEIPGILKSQAEAIVRFRAEHGPIKNADQLSEIIGGQPLGPAARDRLDFEPTAMTAPESPGA